MGLAWSFFNPILMLGVYTFVFSVIFSSRWITEGQSSKVDFAIILFVGMIVHSLFSECVNRAPGLVLANPNYVKRVVFPLEVLPWVAMGSALFHAMVSLLVLLGAFFVSNKYIPWTAIFFPLIVAPLVLVTMGLAWFLAATGVFVRDIGQTTAIACSVLLFLSPVFFPSSNLPEQYKFLMMISPLTFIIEQGRDVLIWGTLPDWYGWAIYCAKSVPVAWLGFWWFQRARKGFADVI
jgi:lipopolysaccharide transport system permease protein